MGVEAVRGLGRSRGRRFLRQLPSQEGGFRCRGPAGGAGHAAQHHPRTGADAVFVHLQGRGRAHHHVPGSRVRQLGVARPRARGRRRDAYLREDLVWLQGGGEEVHEEVVRGHHALTRPGGEDEGGVQGGEGHRQVRGRVRMGDAPPHGAPVPYLQVADDRGGVGQRRNHAPHGFRRRHLGVGGEGAHHQGAPIRPDAAQARYPAQVDEGIGLGQPELHGRKQAVPPGQDLGVLAVFLQEVEGLVQGPGRVVSEASRMHDVPSPGPRPGGRP